MAFHSYRINELYSNASGTIQFIELLVGNVNGESFWQGQTISVSQGGTTHSYDFPNNLFTTATANRSVLVATQGFSNLALVAPEYIVPSQFLFTNGGTVNFANVSIVPYASLPTDGSHSINASGAIGINSPTNFLGFTTSIITINNPAIGRVNISGTTTQGQTLTASHTLADLDGPGPISYQWNANGSAISGATASTFVLNAAQVGSAITVTARFTDNLGTAEIVASGATAAVADINAVPAGKTLDLIAYSWRAHTLLSGVSATGGTHAQTTDANGAASFTSVTETSLAVTASRSVPAAEATLTSQAVNLQDAIAILKMIVGLDVNGAGQPLSAYQSLAADYNGDGFVRLTDAIDVLKHVVGLPAPDPVWRFVNETDAAIPGRAGLTPGAVATSISADVSSALAHLHAGLVGILSGDVDGSFAGASGSQDLGLLQPGYFTDLTREHGLALAQFGVYS